MKIPIQHLLISPSRFVKNLSIFLLIYFSSILVFNSFDHYMPQEDTTSHELCDFPSNEHEEQKEDLKENYEVFTYVEKSKYDLILNEVDFVFFVKDSFHRSGAKEFPTPPPKHYKLIS